jgi:hypothetical protein
VDLHHRDADPDSTYHHDADPDSDFYFMRILIRLFTLMRIRSQIQILASKEGSKPWKSAQKGSYSIHFGLSSQIYEDPDPAYHFDADPVGDTDPDFYLMRMQLRLLKWCGFMRIRILDTEWIDWLPVTPKKACLWFAETAGIEFH